MSKPVKSSRRSRRSRKQHTLSSHKVARPTSAKGGINKSSESRPVAASDRGRQHDPNERIRTLWERKQAELQVRWGAAQAKQASEELVRRRSAKILYGATSIAALAIMLGALALYYTQGAPGYGLFGGDGI